MKRFALTSLVVVVAGMSVPAPAHAQFSSSRNPWCMRDGTFGRGSWDCSYHTFQQCYESASGLGGSCQPNPNYQPRAKATKKTKKRSRQYRYE
jgi:hypothetical protein